MSTNNNYPVIYLNLPSNANESLPQHPWGTLYRIGTFKYGYISAIKWQEKKGNRYLSEKRGNCFFLDLKMSCTNRLTPTSYHGCRGDYAVHNWSHNKTHARFLIVNVHVILHKYLLYILGVNGCRSLSGYSGTFQVTLL